MQTSAPQFSLPVLIEAAQFANIGDSLKIGFGNETPKKVKAAVEFHKSERLLIEIESL